jgi:hypothetical protein
VVERFGGILKFPGVKPLLVAAAPGLGIPLELPGIELLAVRVAVGWLGVGLGVFRIAGLEGPVEFPVELTLLEFVEF